MKSLMKVIKSEAGQALPITLILLALGGLLIVPMLSFMTTNLKTNIQVEGKTEGIYAADAGIQDALWQLGNGIDPFELGDSYDLAENVNGMTVTVDKVAWEEASELYTLRATARLDGNVKAVIIAQAIAGADYSWLFKHALNSMNDVNIQPNNLVYGGVMCGGDFTGDESAVVTGGIEDNADVKMPSVATLTALYLGQVDSSDEATYYYTSDHSHAYTSGSYNVSGGTPSNPVIIPAMYCYGNLSITGSGYAQIEGTIFIDRRSDGTGGQFDFSDKDVTLDLNGQTIFATADSGCTGPPDYQCPGPDAVYFGSDTKLVGPGCVIGVGNVNFQPGESQGLWLIGADPQSDYAPITPVEAANTLVMTKFKTNKKLSSADKLGSFQVKCYVEDPDAEPKAHVKVAVYETNGSGGAPGSLVKAVDATDNLTGSWNTIDIDPAVELQANTEYWLAAISNQAVITIKDGFTEGTASRFKADDFNSFEFTDNPNFTGLIDPGTKEYQLRGFTGGQEFIFLMSVKCTTYLHPGASFYGSIAGNTMVNLQPNCFISLVGMPDDGLNFPGVIGSTLGPGKGGNSPPLLNYNIQ